MSGEERRAEAVTVSWMLCIVATVMAELLGGALFVALRFLPDSADVPPPLKIMPGLLLFVALVTGTLAVVQIPLVYRFRRTPPPRAITYFAVAIAVLPPVVGWLSA